MERLITALIIIGGLINFAPLIGIISGAQVSSLYGLPEPGPDLEILLRHRSLMFGLIGGFMIYGAFIPTWQKPVTVLGLLSMIGFIILAKMVGSYGPEIKKIIIIDLIGILALLIAAAFLFSR